MQNQPRRSEDTHGRVLLAATLAATAVIVVLFGQLIGLENKAFDAFQRYQYKSASEEILLVTADSTTAVGSGVWSAGGFAELTERLNLLGARSVVAVRPLLLPEVPPAEQIMALSELERQAARTASASGDLQRLSAQLAGFRRNYDQQQLLTEQLLTSGNVVLAAQERPFSDNATSLGNCSMHAANTSDAAPDALAHARIVRQLRAPPQTICGASHALGINSYWPDSDNAVRTATLLVNANGLYIPSLALATLSAQKGTNTDIVVVDDRTIVANEQIFKTKSGFEVLMRYYTGKDNTPAFATLTAEEILEGNTDLSKIKGRIVLIGTTGSETPTLATPINDAMPVVEVTATTLSNLLQNDFLLRPAWLPTIETGMVIAILLLAAFLIPPMPAIGAALIGIVLATLIFSIEAWFLVGQKIWVQLATPSLFAAIAVWATYLFRQLPARKIINASGQGQAFKSVATGQYNQLDMEFSVLRQQPVTDKNKERMYAIAFEHGRGEEFACAERVLRFISKHDPNYKDVRTLLSKLSGQQQPEPTLDKAAEKKQYAPLAGASSDKKDSEGRPERRTLGRYLIEKKIGQGAMATVYLGIDPKIGRKVAIKTVALAQEFDEAKLDDARLQFRREAESAGRLNHPNIITIYDAGEDDEVSYLAMEYFDGVSLLKHAQPDDLLPASWVLELTARAAEALDYAHRQNVVHRDIKPANIMYHAASDDLKLTDFGIARLTDSSRTKTGIILGTPSYMSPEQLTASGVTGQSDLYSLGITMYQLLTGTAPFKADSIPKLMDKIMREAHRPVRELRADLPECVDNILTMALAKDPTERFSSGRAMAMALRDCVKQFGSTA